MTTKQEHDITDYARRKTGLNYTPTIEQVLAQVTGRFSVQYERKNNENINLIKR